MAKSKFLKSLISMQNIFFVLESSIIEYDTCSMAHDLEMDRMPFPSLEISYSMDSLQNSIGFGFVVSHVLLAFLVFFNILFILALTYLKCKSYSIGSNITTLSWMRALMRSG